MDRSVFHFLDHLTQRGIGYVVLLGESGKLFVFENPHDEGLARLFSCLQYIGHSHILQGLSFLPQKNQLFQMIMMMDLEEHPLTRKPCQQYGEE